MITSKLVNNYMSKYLEGQKMDNMNLQIDAEEMLKEKKHRQALIMAIELIDDNELLKLLEDLNHVSSN